MSPTAPRECSTQCAILANHSSKPSSKPGCAARRGKSQRKKWNRLRLSGNFSALVFGLPLEMAARYPVNCPVTFAVWEHNHADKPPKAASTKAGSSKQVPAKQVPPKRAPAKQLPGKAATTKAVSSKPAPPKQRLNRYPAKAAPAKPAPARAAVKKQHRPNQPPPGQPQKKQHRPNQPLRGKLRAWQLPVCTSTTGSRTLNRTRPARRSVYE